jgi:integrase
MVRRFAQYCSAIEPRTEIPAPQLLSGHYPRRPPYLYSAEEIDRLLQAARRLPSPTGLRAATYETYLGLLAITGMRMSEAILLDREDVDLSLGVVHVRRAKLGKSRLIPIHPSTREALERYQSLRDRIRPGPQTSSFLLAETGARLGEFSVRATFIKLSHQIGLRGPGDRRGPRLHDFRHRFAVQTLLSWYRSGVDAERCLPQLATYLGHVHVHDTYWYLTAVPELLHWASLRLEATPESSRS